MDIQTACEFGNLRWLQDQKRLGLLGDVTEDDNWAVQRASGNGHLDVVKWLVKESGQPVDVTATENYAVRWAAYYGYLDIITWLVEESGQAVDVTAKDNWAVKSAAAKGYLETVQWLVEKSCQVIDCRDCETWEVRTPFWEWPKNCRVYLIGVKTLQEALGLDSWKTGLDTTAPMSPSHGSHRASRI